MESELTRIPDRHWQAIWALTGARLDKDYDVEDVLRAFATSFTRYYHFMSAMQINSPLNLELTSPAGVQMRISLEYIEEEGGEIAFRTSD